MSIERKFYCDGPECDRRVTTQKATPPVFLTVLEFEGPDLHFCGWDCVLRYAGQKEPEQIVVIDPEEEKQNGD
jgi:hypothetical protein